MHTQNLFANSPVIQVEENSYSHGGNRCGDGIQGKK